MARRPGLVPGLLAAVALATTAVSSEPEVSPVQVAVVAPSDDAHLAWVAASELQRNARSLGVNVALESAALTGTDQALPDLLIMPVRSLATQVPALQVLELPFFYGSLGVVHQRLDGALGGYLADQAHAQGWDVIAWWDEGMHVFSGLKRFDRVRNLKAREFLVTRPDPVAEIQFAYWKADVRRIRPEHREAVLRECLIASRGATLQEVLREELYRVHLSVSLTRHRYEGWVLVAPAARWSRLDASMRERLLGALRQTTEWQRADARQREAAALAELKRRGMTVYELDAEQRAAFRAALPDWVDLLSDELDADQKRVLVELASTGTAAVAGSRDAASVQPH